MFNKLISNLPFNPSLIDQVSFYAKRLRKESGIRRMGFSFMALTMVVQIFAVISPTQANSNSDPYGNDIVSGGFNTRTEAAQKCDSNDNNFKNILLHYKVTCDALRSAGEKNISTTSEQNSLMSLGRVSFPDRRGNEAVQIPEASGTFFRRYLSSWGEYTTKVLTPTASDGQLVWIMFDCGNIVTLNSYKTTVSEPDSNLTLLKANSPNGIVKPGDTITYTLAFTNTGGNAAFFSVDDVLPPEVSLVSTQQGNWTFENKSPNLKWFNNTPFNIFGNTDALGTPGFITIVVKVNNGVKSGTTFCNRASLQDVKKDTAIIRNTPPVQVCNTIEIVCPTGEILQDDGITCKKITVPDAQCVSLAAIPDPKDDSKRKYTFETKSNTVNGANIVSYSYKFGDNDTKTNKNDKLFDKINHEFKTAKTYDVTVVVKSSVADKPSLTCKTSVTINPPDKEPIISISKKAKNITQNQEDANNKTANAGDVIEYSLTTKNISDVEAKGRVLQPENLTDVLEYSDLDLNTLDGAVFDNATKTLAWNGLVNIKGDESITKVFKVKVKNPIPSTPRPVNQDSSTSGDLLMQNIYGNQITIKLPSTPIKTTEIVTTTLPNTGPGTSLTIGFTMVTVVGYFYSRNRLMAKELDIVKVDYTTTSGGQ